MRLLCVARLHLLAVQMCVFVRMLVYSVFFFLYDKVGVSEASDGSQTLALFYLMLRWQLLTKGIHTCVYNLSYGSKQTRDMGHLLAIQFDTTQTKGRHACFGFLS